MIVSTTPTLEGRRIVAYLGLVSGEAVMGANIFRDLFAAVRDIVGGQAGAYEKVLKDARDVAVGEMTERGGEPGRQCRRRRRPRLRGVGRARLHAHGIGQRDGGGGRIGPSVMAGLVPSARGRRHPSRPAASRTERPHGWTDHPRAVHGEPRAVRTRRPPSSRNAVRAERPGGCRPHPFAGFRRRWSLGSKLWA